MGENCDMVKFLKAGFVIHHHDLPDKLRIKIEQLGRHQFVKLIVTTTTLAQGVNLPIRTIIVHSLQQGENRTVNSLDFWNICGRAGRGMKENEGQLLFSVDLTEAWDKRRRKDKLRQQLIEGFQANQLMSALRILLNAIVEQWQKSHPNVDVAELCRLLAENNVEWAPSEVREELSQWIDFLDAQLIALAEEQNSEELTPDDLQNLLQRSLLILQLNSEPEGILTTQLANNLLYSRLQSIRIRFQARTQRQRFYRLGFPVSDCVRIEEHKEDLLEKFLLAEDFYNWGTEKRSDFLASILEFVFDLQELKPKESSLPKCFKETWKDIWWPILRLWLQGFTANEMVNETEIAEITTSPADVSILLDDLFGYRAPWGVNALNVYLQEIVKETIDEIPTVANYFSAVLKYGVHSPAACALLAFGLESRKLALKLAAHCPDEVAQPDILLNWFIMLTNENLAKFEFTQDEMTKIKEAQRSARSIRSLSQRNQGGWFLEVQIQKERGEKLKNGDSLLLRIPPNNTRNELSIYTLWGDFVGTFSVEEQIPESWTKPNLIEATIVEVAKRLDGFTLDIRIEEV